MISSLGRYPDFEGKQLILTGNSKVCKPLKNQRFPAI